MRRIRQTKTRSADLYPYTRRKHQATLATEGKLPDLVLDEKAAEEEGHYSPCSVGNQLKCPDWNAASLGILSRETMRILLVEDFELLRDSLATGLRKAGYAVDVAAEGKTGLWYAKTVDYDVIILDLMLPEIDGLSILRQLRQRRPRDPCLDTDGQGHFGRPGDWPRRRRR